MSTAIRTYGRNIIKILRLVHPPHHLHILHRQILPGHVADLRDRATFIDQLHEVLLCFLGEILIVRDVFLDKFSHRILPVNRGSFGLGIPFLYGFLLSEGIQKWFPFFFSDVADTDVPDKYLTA